MDRQWWKKLNWILFLQVGSKFSRRRYDLRRVQQSNCACRASSHEGWFAILLSTCSSASRGDNEKDKSLHDVTWCEWHLESELPGCLQHPRKPPNLSLLDAGQLFLVKTVFERNQRETIFGTPRRTPLQRSVHMRVQPTQSIQHELHRFVRSFSWDTPLD